MKTNLSANSLKAIIILALLTLTVLFIGCVAPSAARMSAGDPGPFPDAYRQLTTNWISETFFDPYSVRDLEITAPVKGAVGKALIHGGGYVYAWRSFVSANAKNRMGGYTGKQMQVLYFRDGKVIASGNVYHGQLPDMMF